jgi:chemotaxis protein MotB
MARNKRSDERPNHERWLVSYADFITLLFAFFVVMYAISTVNDGKYRVMSDALTAAFRHERVVRPPDSPQTAARVMTPTPRPAVKTGDPVKRQREQRLMGLAGKISDALRPLVQTGQVRLTQTTRGLAVEISASVLFSPGQAALRPDSTTALAAVAAVLATVDNAVHVEGHTDNIPIAGTQYPSNWELASARASSVVRLFVAGGVDPARLVALGYADNRPVEANVTAVGRARNRRVTLLILADKVDATDSMAAAASMVVARP